MPIYEYQCEDCGYRSEELQKMGARPLRKCPECGGKYTKLISAPAFQFKGSGWYVTDYARKDQGGGKKSDSSDSSSSSSSGSDSSKSQSKKKDSSNKEKKESKGSSAKSA